MTALIVDGNDFARSFTKNIFSSFHFRDIVTTATAREGIAALKGGGIDVVITEWHLNALTAATFVKGIRTLDVVRDNQIPVIVLTACAQSEAVFGARDCGANDFVSRPLVLQSFLSRMTQHFDSPRSFIRTAGYCGPDRRRKQALVAGRDRRQPVDGTGMVGASSLIGSFATRIRRPGGLTIPEMAANGEKVILAEAVRYGDVARSDVRELMAAIRAFKDASGDAASLAETIYLKSHDLRGMGETFHLPLLTAAGASLCRLLWGLPPDRLREAAMMQGIETHAMVMSLVVMEDIRDDGGEIGAELLAGLDAISNKARASES